MTNPNPIDYDALAAQLGGVSVDELKKALAPLAKPAEPTEQPISKVSMYATLRRVERSNTTGHVIAIEGSHESYNVGIINLSAGWKTGARVKWSVELCDPPSSTAAPGELLVPSPELKPPGEIVQERIEEAAGPKDWHYSHNVSDTLWTCYGCGVAAGDPKLYEPCPTPDHVGRMAIASEERKRGVRYSFATGGASKVEQ